MNTGLNVTGEWKRDQIDRYVNDNMREEERLEFEQRMREHAELAQTVHVHRDVLRGMELYFMQELKQKLIRSDQPKKKKMPVWAIAAIVAGVLLLLSGLAYFFDLI